MVNSPSLDKNDKKIHFYPHLAQITRYSAGFEHYPFSSVCTRYIRRNKMFNFMKSWFLMAFSEKVIFMKVEKVLCKYYPYYAHLTFNLVQIY